MKGSPLKYLARNTYKLSKPVEGSWQSQLGQNFRYVPIRHNITVRIHTIVSNV